MKTIDLQEFRALLKHTYEVGQFHQKMNRANQDEAKKKKKINNIKPLKFEDHWKDLFFKEVCKQDGSNIGEYFNNFKKEKK